MTFKDYSCLLEYLANKHPAGFIKYRYELHYNKLQVIPDNLPISQKERTVFLKIIKNWMKDNGVN